MMFFLLNCIALSFAFFIDIIAGELPLSIHPVVYIGKLIQFLEKKLYYKFSNKLFSGTIMVLLTLAIVLTPIFFLSRFLWNLNKFTYVLFSIFVFFSAISIKSLKQHIENIKTPLKQDNITKARRNLSLIVSRDVNYMDKNEILKSALESLSENFVDSVFAPMFYSLFGPVICFLFKTVNTLDSMVGYKNIKYKDFGKIAARADDLLGFLPARLSIVPISLGSYILYGRFVECIMTFLRFRRAHSSPNAAHGMSAFAGALNISLGGPAIYFGKKVDKPYIGTSDKKITISHIDKGIYLFMASSLCSLLLLLVFVLILNLF